MKTINYTKLLGFVLFFFASYISLAQVGIGQNSPKGALDISSSTMGVIFPVVALVDASTETVVNPNGPNIVAGTTVYNTTTTSAGADSLYPGIFFWTGSKWQSQRERKDNKLFLQDTSVRTGSDDSTYGTSGDQSINFDSNSFTPIYTGKYAVHLVVHYGAGSVNTPSGAQFVNMAKEEGVFEFTFNGSTYAFDLSAFSSYNNDTGFNGGSARISTNLFNQVAEDFEETLNAGTNYPFTLTFNQATAPGFEADGDEIVAPPEDGRGYITINNSIKCSIEINYVFE
ncbi:MAG: hypothetical protein JKY22_03450 [Flavobacteriaceae bacterium]|nr:hypothetical protein [Flavobacteriaceae bacterium]